MGLLRSGAAKFQTQTPKAFGASCKLQKRSNPKFQRAYAFGLQNQGNFLCRRRARSLGSFFGAFLSYATPMLNRNSILLLVFLSLLSTNSIASTGGTPVSARRRMTTLLYSSGW